VFPGHFDDLIQRGRGILRGAEKEGGGVDRARVPLGKRRKEDKKQTGKGWNCQKAITGKRKDKEKRKTWGRAKREKKL